MHDADEERRRKGGRSLAAGKVKIRHAQGVMHEAFAVAVSAKYVTWCM